MKRQRGSAMVEFILVGTFIFVPILTGLGTVGISLIRGMEAASLNSTAGQLFSSGVDMTATTGSQNQSNLMLVAGGLNSSSGVVVILSEINQNSNGPYCSQQITIPSSASRISAVVGTCDPTVTLGSSFTSMLEGYPEASTMYVAETYVDNTLYSFNGHGTGIYVVNFF